MVNSYVLFQFIIPLARPQSPLLIQNTDFLLFLSNASILVFASCSGCWELGGYSLSLFHPGMPGLLSLLFLSLFLFSCTVFSVSQKTLSRALPVLHVESSMGILSLPLPLILWTFCRCLFYLPMSFPFEVSELLITWQHSLLSLSLSHTCCHACHLLRVKFECTYHKIWWCTLCAYFMYV